jgi:hypothetical protein
MCEQLRELGKEVLGPDAKPRQPPFISPDATVLWVTSDQLVATHIYGELIKNRTLHLYTSVQVYFVGKEEHYCNVCRSCCSRNCHRAL